MALRRTILYGPGHIAIDDAGDLGNGTSGNVSNDGRVKVQFHENPTALAAWFQGFQNGVADNLAVEDADLKRQRSRRPSNVAFLEHLGPQRKSADSPRLHIAIPIVGSRGDVQPFIPIAQMLSRAPYNHRVRICTHPVFKEFVEAQGVEFFSIGGDPEALMAYMVKNPGLLPGRESFKAGEISKRRKEMAEIIDGVWRSCIEAGDGTGPRISAANVSTADNLFLADAIIANPPSMAHIHCAERLGIPLHMVFTMPWSPTGTFSHPLANMSYGNADAGTANYLSYMMMELLTWQGLGDLINKFRTQTLQLDPISSMWGYQLLPRLRVPYTYLWSKSLIPKPKDWDDYINITGFSFLPLAHSYSPPADLTAFLEAGPPPIYIGFGSIVIDDPIALTQLIIKAVEIAGVRAIVSKGWGGVGSSEDVSKDIYLIGNCPHDWLFQRVSVVVHHGGAGTTAAGIAAGRPTVVIPFFGDQPFWGRMIARAIAGPTPVPFKEMTAELLAASIKFALKPEVQLAVVQMAENIRKEDGAGEAVLDFQKRLDVDSMRCDLCPDRLASWKHKKSDAHLSGFAVACLVDQGMIQLSDINLLRHRHWYVDEGAEHPIIGAVAAVTGFITAVATATSDYSQRLKNRPKPSSPAPDVEMMTPARPPSSGAQGKNNDADVRAESTGQAEVQDGALKEVPPPSSTLTPADMETVALKMATKSIHLTDTATARLREAPTRHEKHKAAWQAREQGRHGELYYIVRATGRFAADVSKASLKAPVALLYNMANGCHNYPSYSFGAIDVRRRDEITGLGSGIRTAGKEFRLGIWDAVSGIVVKPYEAAKADGPKALGKGLWRGARGFVHNFSAALFGVPGYSLKGLEKELSKHHLNKLKAEVYLIRLRQGIEEFRRGTAEDKDEVVQRWKDLLTETHANAL